MKHHEIIIGDVIDGLRSLTDGSFHCCVTSPPYYGLRDYGVDGQIGLEKTPEEFIKRLVAVFDEVWRVLRDDGTCWVNMGDSYARAGGEAGGGNRELIHLEGKQRRMTSVPRGVKEKDLMGMPWRLALALRDAGWHLRQDIIWAKPNPMPESVTDRCTKSHEYLFLLTKSPRYFYDAEAIKESEIKGASGSGFNTGKTATHQLGRASDGERAVTGTRNRRSVWTIATQPTPEAHFATFPEALVVPCILAGTSENGVCAECGAPWVRIVERTAMVLDRSERTHERGRTRSSGTMVEPPKSTTTGWQPSCDCNSGIVPAVVLDPFLGSGTTLAVAKKLGRHGVGCELNPDYAEIARKKIMFARIGDIEKQRKPLEGQKLLFAEN